MSSIAQIAGVAGEMNSLAEMLIKRQSVAVRYLRAVIDKYEEVKDDVHIYITLQWEKSCKAANAEHLQRTMEVIARTSTRKTTYNHAGGAMTTTNNGHDIYIRSEPKTWRALIKKVDIDKLDRAIRAGGTCMIRMTYVRIQYASSGTEIVSLQPVGGDLSPLYTPLEVKTHISNAFVTLSPDASLLRIPPVALLKLATVRLSTAQIFFIEHFGHLVWKDPVIVPVGKSKYSSTSMDMTVIPATKDLCARTTSLTALMNDVNGLCFEIDIILHPSIQSADRARDMFRHLMNV